jgi:hypothetical protein
VAEDVWTLGNCDKLIVSDEYLLNRTDELERLCRTTCGYIKSNGTAHLEGMEYTACQYVVMC